LRYNLEVEVRAHRRVIRRRRYRPTCSCGVHSGIVTAPPPPRLIPKSILGVSIWVAILLDKYLFYRPTYRLLDDWSTLGLDLSLGTVTGGLKRLVPLFEGLIVLAFCWAHVRRDFLATARSWPDQEAWAMGCRSRTRPLSLPVVGCLVRMTGRQRGG